MNNNLPYNRPSTGPANIQSPVQTFHHQTYPFPNSTAHTPTALKTVVQVSLNPLKLQKIVRLNHPNIIGIRKIVKSNSREGVDAGRQYSFYYEVVHFSLLALAEQPETNSRLSNLLFASDLRGVLRSVVSYLQELGIYYKPKLHDIGISVQGNLKVFVSPVVIFESRYESGVQRLLEEMGEWWEDYVETRSSNMFKKEKRQLQPPQLANNHELEFEEPSVPDSTLEKQLGDLLAEEETEKPKVALNSSTNSLSKFGNSQIEKIKMLDQEVKFIRERFTQKQSKVYSSHNQGEGGQCVGGRQAKEHVGGRQAKEYVGGRQAKNQGKQVAKQMGRQEVKMGSRQQVKAINRQEVKAMSRQGVKAGSKEIKHSSKQPKHSSKEIKHSSKEIKHNSKQPKSQKFQVAQQSKNEKRYELKLDSKDLRPEKYFREPIQQNINCINIYNHNNHIAPQSKPHFPSPPTRNHYFDPHFITEHHDDQDSQDTYDIEFDQVFDTHEPTKPSPDYNRARERELSEYSVQARKKTKEGLNSSKKKTNRVCNKNYTESAGPLQFKSLLGRYLLPEDKEPNEEEQKLEGGQKEANSISNYTPQSIRSASIDKTMKQALLPRSNVQSVVDKERAEKIKRIHSQNELLGARTQGKESEIEERVRRALEKTKNAIALLNRVKSTKTTVAKSTFQ